MSLVVDEPLLHPQVGAGQELVQEHPSSLKGPVPRLPNSEDNLLPREDSAQLC